MFRVLLYYKIFEQGAMFVIDYYFRVLKEGFIMWLELHKVKVRDVRWGDATKVEGGGENKTDSDETCAAISA
jgi:hypothetical protein